MCLGFPVDDFQTKPGLFRNPVNEFRPVRRKAAGLRRNQALARDLVPFQLVGADAQRLDGALHGGIIQAAMTAQPLAQPNDARKGIDHLEARSWGWRTSRRQLLVPRSSAP